MAVDCSGSSYLPSTINSQVSVIYGFTTCFETCNPELVNSLNT
jgi:hypothetical protein